MHYMVTKDHVAMHTCNCFCPQSQYVCMCVYVCVHSWGYKLHSHDIEPVYKASVMKVSVSYAYQGI